MGILQSLFGKENELTDDEKELREYEENVYMGLSGVSESTYSEFVVEDIFRIKDKVTVTGKVTTGVFSVGDKIEIVRGSNIIIEAVILSIQQFKSKYSKISEGENGAMLIKIENSSDIRLVKRNDIIKKV